MITGTRTAAAPAAIKVSEPVDPIFRQIRDLVYRVCGIFQLEEKLYLLVDGCARRMKQVERAARASIGIFSRIPAANPSSGNC